MSKPRVIAFYLPQFHPTIDNDKWWGKGFTEWTNVGKAKPLFPGHDQPKVPADLGYYDLRIPEVREAQAELAREAGIYGFCYYHYWFGNGREELELPFNEVLRLGKPDFPFMLCWANESWHKKFWNKDGDGMSKEVLVEQMYPGKDDIIDHFYRLLPAFKDPRYIRIKERPAFMIYRPSDLVHTRELISTWNELARKEGLNSIYFIAHQMAKDLVRDEEKVVSKLMESGYDAININMGMRVLFKRSLFRRIVSKFFRSVFRKRPIVIDYSEAKRYFESKIDLKENIFPTLMPNWDHTPRSGHNGVVFKNSTPKAFYKVSATLFNKLKSKTYNFIFLKSWNEWGEGNYIEPDLKIGKGYIKALKEAINSIK